MGCETFEIKSTERTDGTAGFWWCGRYGMRRLAMPIEKSGMDFSKYDKVIICSPVWVFGMAAPIRSFCEADNGKVKAYDLILIHHTGNRYMKTADEIDEILGVRREVFRSFKCHTGKIREITV